MPSLSSGRATCGHAAADGHIFPFVAETFSVAHLTSPSAIPEALRQVSIESQ